ncbi:MAG TPA: enoyl-CoA hydratase/isomerase family protein [Nocardioidaceae bacterium]|nr:enoyl-CoA hydratase/isomerase family protein [Nocardioidaceae bacterium]
MEQTEQLTDTGIRLEVDGAVATVVLDRPDKRNAQTPAMWEALAEVGDSLDAGVRVVVLRGEGASFSAGLDRRMFTPEGVPGQGSLFGLTELDDEALAATIEHYQRAFTWWRRPEVVTVAAVQGHALGAGFQLALACDLRVLAEDAQLAMLEPSLGLVPDLGGTKPLVDLVGYGRALEICATGRTVGAAEAAEIGLATIVVPADELTGAVRDLTDALAAAPHGAVTGTKRLLQGAVARDYDAQRAAERGEQVSRLRELAAAMRGS